MNIPPTTKFTQLPKDIQQTLIHYQTLFDQESKHADSILSRPTQQLEKVKNGIKQLEDEITDVEIILRNDIRWVGNLKKQVRVQVRHTQQSKRETESLEQNNMKYYDRDEFQLPSQYFWDLLEIYESTMQKYQLQIQEIEQYLSSISTGEERIYTPELLKRVMENQYEYFTNVASAVGLIHEQLQDMKTKILISQNISLENNPFEAAKQKANNTQKKILLPPPSAYYKNDNQNNNNNNNSNNNNSTNSGSSGFGSNSSGFGSNKSSGFGSNKSSGFGSNKSSGFGSSNSTSGFGSNKSSGFGSNSSGFGSNKSSGFGSNSSGFGSNKSSGLGSNKSSGFGSNKSSGFGSNSSTSGSGFGSKTKSTSFSFGNKSTSSNSGSGFGSNKKVGFSSGNQSGGKFSFGVKK
eukprot:TRINITY_DN318_c0_g4_i2.p1 TRINITY_DN318_c0_g4~~TRINITY_DN318_c0_g4_i2.p1  ORF type:complete len:406 (+),score=117.03 TRINITY_DN318_c0_g4_i2:206-1423(+)